MKKEKILFFYLKTGNGHYAIAKSISDFLENNYSKNVSIVNAIENSNFIIKFLLQDFYNKIQLNFKFIYEFIFWLNENKFSAKMSIFMVNLLLRNKIKNFIKREKPDKIVSAHFFLNKSIVSVLKELKLDIPFVTIVTDPFTVSLLWFVEKNQKFIISSNEVKKVAISMGVDVNLLKMLPVVISSKYSGSLPNKKEISILKNKYLKSSNKTILILSGGGGFPNGINIFKELIKNNYNSNIIFVCGSDKIMFNKINKIKESLNLQNVIVYGFVDFIYDLINISDVVVTKAGTSCIMEILLSKKIPVIASYIWKQEKGNMEFVVNNKLGVYEKHPKKLSLIVRDILSSDKVYDKYINNIEKKELKNGLEEVSEYIVSL